MKNIIDYYIHKSYEPSYYQRQFEKDLPKELESDSFSEKSKRIALLALPFLSLYHPIGNALSLTMGSTRVFTTSISLVHSDNLGSLALQVGQLSLAILALAGTLYHFTLGLFLTTGVDITFNLVKILETLLNAEYQKAGEECLQALSSGLYLAIIMTGSLEVVLTSLLIQAFISFYQARKEWSQGKIPEAVAKSLMGMIRLYQANQQHVKIQRRNLLFKKYQEFISRIQKSRKIDHLWDHPLIERAKEQSTFAEKQKITSQKTDAQKKLLPLLPSNSNREELNSENFSDQIDRKKIIMEDAEGIEYDFGSHFFGYGKQVVKGMNISFQEKEDQIQLDFKINHVFRDRLERLIRDVDSYSKEELKDLLDIFGSRVKDITINKVDHLNSEDFFDYEKVYEIHLQGLGKIFVGASSQVITLYDKVSVQMDKGKNLYDFHEALSFFHLDDALKASANEDMERMKMAYLYRMFDPKSATPFERTDRYFDLSFEDFKKAIQLRSPMMIDIFDQYLSRVEFREIIPGKKHFAINGLVNEIELAGARGLTAALEGFWDDDEEMFKRVASILQMGMLSSEMRNNIGMNKSGLSWGLDYYTGGADTVFTQIVTKKNRSYYDFGYWSPIRFLISPQLLERYTYQYHYDNFGTRIVDESGLFFDWFEDEYANRENIFDFIREENRDFSFSNEVMIKDRIPPEYFTGLVVQDHAMKNNLIDILRKCNLLQKNEQGQETIFSKLIDDFIYVGNTIFEDHFK